MTELKINATCLSEKENIEARERRRSELQPRKNIQSRQSYIIIHKVITEYKEGGTDGNVFEWNRSNIYQ